MIVNKFSEKMAQVLGRLERARQYLIPFSLIVEDDKGGALKITATVGANKILLRNGMREPIIGLCLIAQGHRDKVDYSDWPHMESVSKEEAQKFIDKWIKRGANHFTYNVIIIKESHA